MSQSTTSILIVEDDPQITVLLGAVLDAEGFRVMNAVSGEEALVAVEESKPSLVILDIELPGIDGFTTCRRIRELSQAPIVMVTGLGGLQDRVRGLELGADDYIAKPFRPGELVARVKALLRRCGLPEEGRRSGVGL